MNRISLIAAGVGALLILAACSLYALLHDPWMRIERHAAATSYYDPASVAVHNGKLRMRLLLDYDAPQTHQKGAYRSMIETLVLNCAERGYHSEKRVTYADQAATGAALFEDASPLPYKRAPKFFEPIFAQHCRG